MWRMKGSFEAHGSHVRILSGPVYIIMWHSFKYQIKHYGRINNNVKILFVSFQEVSFLN